VRYCASTCKSAFRFLYLFLHNTRALYDHYPDRATHDAHSWSRIGIWEISLPLAIHIESAALVFLAFKDSLGLFLFFAVVSHHSNNPGSRFLVRLGLEVFCLLPHPKPPKFLVLLSSVLVFSLMGGRKSWIGSRLTPPPTTTTTTTIGVSPVLVQGGLCKAIVSLLRYVVSSNSCSLFPRLRHCSFGVCVREGADICYTTTATYLVLLVPAMGYLSYLCSQDLALDQ